MAEHLLKTVCDVVFSLDAHVTPACIIWPRCGRQGEKYKRYDKGYFNTLLIGAIRSRICSRNTHPHQACARHDIKETEVI